MAYEPHPGTPLEEKKKIFAAIKNRQLTRATQALMGICSGIVADAHLHDREVQFLSTWLAENADVSKQWPGNEVARRVKEVMADGILTDTERADLLDVLQKLLAISLTTRVPRSRRGLPYRSTTTRASFSGT